MSEWTWVRGDEVLRIYSEAVERFRRELDDGGWEDPTKQAVQYGLLTVAKHAADDALGVDPAQRTRVRFGAA